jgi:hypothetical protein
LFKDIFKGKMKEENENISKPNETEVMIFISVTSKHQNKETLNGV